MKLNNLKITNNGKKIQLYILHDNLLTKTTKTKAITMKLNHLK